MRKFLKDKKEILILTAAAILPLGLPALGVWKAVELYKKNKRKQKNDKKGES